MAGCVRGGSQNTNAEDNANDPNLQRRMAGNNLPAYIFRCEGAVHTALTNLQNGQWQSAASMLESARQDAEKAMADQKIGQFAQSFADLKAAIDRTLIAVNNHTEDALAQVQELQNRVYSIKMQSQSSR